MHLSTFSSKFTKKTPLRLLLITLSWLGVYHFLVITKIVMPFDGINQWQINFIKIQRYAYQAHSSSNIVLVGSSLTSNIKASYIGSQVINLGMSGGSAQTGIAAVRRNTLKPAILLIEVNESINNRIDSQMIDSIYNPWLYYVRLYIPMLRQEYQPVSVFLPTVASLKSRLIKGNSSANKQQDSKQDVNIDPSLTNTLIFQQIEANKIPLTEKEKSLLKQEANYIKSQILQVEKDNVRVILFDVPIENRVQDTVRKQQIQALLRELFPINKFEWLPQPLPRHWRTSDGIHLVSSDAKDYAAFLKNQIIRTYAN